AAAAGVRRRGSLADPADRVLPAAVPPHPGKRSVVGQGLHGVDERGARHAAVRRPRTAAPAGRARLLRSPAARGARGASGDGARARHRGLLLLPLLVRRTSPPRTPVRGSAALEATELSVLPLLGERELVAPLGWLGTRDPHGAAPLARRGPT